MAAWVAADAHPPTPRRGARVPSGPPSHRLHRPRPYCVGLGRASSLASASRTGRARIGAQSRARGDPAPSAQGTPSTQRAKPCALGALSVCVRDQNPSVSMLARPHWHGLPRASPACPGSSATWRGIRSRLPPTVNASRGTPTTSLSVTAACPFTPSVTRRTRSLWTT